MVKKYFLLILILIFAGFLLFYKLNEIPAGLNNDQVSVGYNAYSILKTGADRYGMMHPLLFRSLGTYLLPLYTYLTVGVFALLGVTKVGISLVSVICGLLILLLTYLIFKNEDEDNKFPFSITITFILSFTPWLIFFSRSSIEVTLSLAFFLSGLYFLMGSLKKPYQFIIGCFLLGFPSWIYYSERLTVLIFLPIFLIVFRRALLRNKKIVLIGLVIFALTQAPNLFLLKTGAVTRRFSQVSYLSYGYFVQNGSSFKNLPFGQLLYISKEFISRYISYFSPRSLFFDPDEQTLRSMPDLSVFYNWMIIPFILGIVSFVKSKKTDLDKVILILILVSIIPAALTVEPFYTMRVILFLWAITVIITRGIAKFPKFLIVLLFAYSLFALYRSYFVLFRYEREADFGHQYYELVNIIESNRNKNFVIDNSRDPAICIRIAFLTLYDPREFQKSVVNKILSNYYSNYQVNENCVINNAEVRQINWGTDIGDNIIVVGDPYAISDREARVHNLKLIFEIKDSYQNTVLIGFSKKPV